MSKSRLSASLICARVRDARPLLLCRALAIDGVEIRSKQIVRRTFILSFLMLSSLHFLSVIEGRVKAEQLNRTELAAFGTEEIPQTVNAQHRSEREYW